MNPIEQVFKIIDCPFYGDFIHVKYFFIAKLTPNFKKSVYVFI